MQTLDVNPSNTNICFFFFSMFASSSLRYFVLVHGCCASLSEPHLLTLLPALTTSHPFVDSSPYSLRCPKRMHHQPCASVQQNYCFYVAGSTHRPPPSHFPETSLLKITAMLCPSVCLLVRCQNCCCPSTDRRILCYNYINCDANDSLFYGQSPPCHTRTLFGL